MNSFTPTAIQDKALDLLTSGVPNTLLYGGSRSGKTFIAMYDIVYRALKVAGSRHCVVRKHFNAVKTAIVMDTLPSVMQVCFPGVRYRINKTDWYCMLPNGSEIWFFGLDDDKFADKILGKEYATIYYNESSELSYGAVCTAQTRLAQKTDLFNMSIYDCNPASKYHWNHKLFVENVDPLTNEPVDPSMYCYILMNPRDNEVNLPEGYIERTLESLPPSKKKRFLHGEWGVPEGLIFEPWPVADDSFAPQSAMYGLDFGYNDPMALIEIGIRDSEFVAKELYYKSGQTIQDLIAFLDKSGISKRDPIIADSANPDKIEELCRAGYNCIKCRKGQGSIMSGIGLMQAEVIHTRESNTNLNNELESYAWDTDRHGIPLERPIDNYNHAIDAIRYVIAWWTLKKNNRVMAIAG